MKRTALILLLTATPGLAGAATPDLFCTALGDFSASVARAGEPANIQFGIIEGEGSYCRHRGGSAGEKAFCDLALPNTSIEFAHVFPWKVDQCLRREGLSVSKQTVDQYTGFDMGLDGSGKITRLTATDPSGVTLEVLYKPDPDDKSEGRYKDYYGEYSLSLSPPAGR